MRNTIKHFPNLSGIPMAATRIILIILFIICLSCSVQAQTSMAPVHDPVLIRQDSTYYIFSTGRGISVWPSVSI